MKRRVRKTLQRETIFLILLLLYKTRKVTRYVKRSAQILQFKKSCKDKKAKACVQLHRILQKSTHAIETGSLESATIHRYIHLQIGLIYTMEVFHSQIKILKVCVKSNGAGPQQFVHQQSCSCPPAQRLSSWLPSPRERAEGSSRAPREPAPEIPPAQGMQPGSQPPFYSHPSSTILRLHCCGGCCSGSVPSPKMEGCSMRREKRNSDEREFLRLK